MRTVAIVGAGITGLSAAWHLRRTGVPVTIYESGAAAGGAIRSRRDGPWLAEGGPNTILETSPEVREFVNQLGLAARRMYSSPAASPRYVVRDGRPVLLPGSAVKFFATPLFSLGSKLRLLREPFVGRGRGEESVASFVRRRLGTEFLEYAVDPLVTGIYAGDPERLSVLHAFPRLHALEARYGSLICGQLFGAAERRKRAEVAKSRAPKFSFDDGLQVLPDTIASGLAENLRFGAEVEVLELTSAGWSVRTRGNGKAMVEEHSAVLLCGTACGLSAVKIEAPGAPSLRALAEILHPPVTSVVLGFRRADVAHPAVGFGMLIPHREGFGILGTIFSSSLFERRAPEGHVLLTTYVGGVRRPAAAGLGDGPLVDLVLRDLGRLLGVSGRPVFMHITRWPRAIPQYEVGFGRYKALFDELEAKVPGVFVAGHLRDGVALSDSIQAGIRAAGRIRGHLASPALAAQTSPAPQFS